MTLQQAFESRNSLTTKERARICNKLRVLENIIKGLYDDEESPLKVAQDDLDILNGDKIL